MDVTEIHLTGSTLPQTHTEGENGQPQVFASELLLSQVLPSPKHYLPYQLMSF